MEEQLNLFDFQVETIRVEPKSRLTPRQWALYRLVKENTEAGRKTSQREIYEKVEGYSWNEKETGGSRSLSCDLDGYYGRGRFDFLPRDTKDRHL